MSRARKLVLTAATCATIAGCALAWRAWVGSVEHAVRAEQAALDAARPRTDDSVVAARLLANLQAELEACAPCDAALGTPWTWARGMDPVLRAELAELGPFYADVDALCEHPAVRRALEQRARLGVRVWLGASRNRTNLLCARAVLDARDGQRDEAARRLAQALDLVLLTDEPDGWGYAMSLGNEDIVLDCVAHLLREGCGGAAELRTALEPRLTRLADVRRIEDAARGNCLAHAQYTPCRADLVQQLPQGIGTPICAARALADLRRINASPLSTFSEPLRSSGRPHFGDVCTDFLAEGAALGRSRLDLARAALSVAAWREQAGEWPVELADPSLVYVRDSSRARLASAEALAAPGVHKRLPWLLAWDLGR